MSHYPRLYLTGVVYCFAGSVSSLEFQTINICKGIYLHVPNNQIPENLLLPLGCHSVVLNSKGQGYLGYEILVIETEGTTMGTLDSIR